MKQKLSAILAVLATFSCFASCSVGLNSSGLVEKNSSVEASSMEESLTSTDSVYEEADSSVEEPDSSVEEPDSSEENPDSSEENPDSSADSSDSSGEDEFKYTYQSFTPAEKQLCETYLGEALPFVANNEYYLETVADVDYTWINFYTFDNTKAEFDAYRAQYNDYTFIETYEDEYGDTWYCYEKGYIYVELSYYFYEGAYVIDVYAVYDDGSAGGDVGGGEEDGEYLYHDFTATEKALFTQYIGEIIPFLPNDEYYVEGYYEETDYENGMWVGFYDVTEMGFALYRGMYSDYDFVDEYEDEEGDTWYCYEKDDVYVEMVYYYTEEGYVLEVYVTSSLSAGGGDVGGGDVGGGDVGGGDEDVDLMTNDGKGLPTEADGVYDVDFTNATYVKDVTEQGYYLDGCPTKGNVKVLVIPVEFSDVTAASKGYSLEKVNLAFNGGAGTTDYYSVSEYYNISSYGQLDLEFVVWDSWFRPTNNSSYYASATMDYYGSDVEVGDQMIMDEALAYLEGKMDLSQFDADGNAIIDAVVMVNTLEIDSESNFQWAYRYWNLYTNDEGYYYEYDGVSANDYLWAPYQFLMEAYDNEGEVYYDEDVMNTYTFIHEFGHVLGADDYYDTAYVGAPMDGLDIMDSMLGDHNAYTKFNYGWLTNSRLIVAEESVTVTLEAFSDNGDTIIIANNWDDALGAYQEYFIVVYYTQSGLNGGDYGYFLSEGIIVYHVNASLYKEVVETETYYDVYNNNTDASDEYGTVNNLIEYVTHEDGHYVFLEGESLSANVKTDAGENIAYTFTVDALTADGATLTFEKNN